MTTERERLAAFMLDARMGLAADKPSPYGEMADRLSGAVLTSDWLTAHTATAVNAAVEAAAVRLLAEWKRLGKTATTPEECGYMNGHAAAARAVRGDS